MKLVHCSLLILCYFAAVEGLGGVPTHLVMQMYRVYSSWCCMTLFIAALQNTNNFLSQQALLLPVRELLLSGAW